MRKLNNFKNKIYKLEKNILLKIDCQGTEMDVLIGANKIIKSFSCIFLEVSLVNLYQKQKLWLEVINYLKKINFEVWSVDQLLKNNKTGQTYQLDIFFYKKIKYENSCYRSAGFIGFHISKKLLQDKKYYYRDRLDF